MRDVVLAAFRTLVKIIQHAPVYLLRSSVDGGRLSGWPAPAFGRLRFSGGDTLQPFCLDAFCLGIQLLVRLLVSVVVLGQGRILCLQFAYDLRVAVALRTGLCTPVHLGKPGAPPHAALAVRITAGSAVGDGSGHLDASCTNRQYGHQTCRHSAIVGAPLSMWASNRALNSRFATLLRLLCLPISIHLGEVLHHCCLNPGIAESGTHSATATWSVPMPLVRLSQTIRR